MALTAKSLFLYGFETSSTKASIDFRAVMSGPVIMATLRLGPYSLTGLMTEIKRAMEAADPLRTYTVTANRTLSGGTQNRISIATSGSYLDLLFGSGPRVASSISSLIGFTATDQTGATTYTGSSTAGISLIPDYNGYTYLGPDLMRNVFGATTVSAGGTKETVVWSVQKFLQVEFRFEPEAKTISEWTPFMTWAIQQKPFEFTPEISSPSVFHNVTLESTGSDGKGLGYKIEEMLPDFPFHYKTGMLKMRVTQ